MTQSTKLKHFKSKQNLLRHSGKRYSKRNLSHETGRSFHGTARPTEGSEQAGTRPVIIVSRNALNTSSPVVLVVPCTTYRTGRRVYPTQVLIQAPDGGLDRDSIALGEQVRVLAKTRLLEPRGELSETALSQLNQALLIALDLIIPSEETP